MELDLHQLLALVGSLALGRVVNKAVDAALAALTRWWRRWRK